MHIHKILTTLLVTVALMLGIVACAVPGVTPPAPDSGGDNGGTTATGGLVGSWNSLNIKGSPVDAEVFPTLIFDSSGAVAGNGGCNGYGGTYATEGGNLTIEGVVSTMMACEDQTLMDQEVQFFEAIQQTATYTIEANTLTLIDVDGNVLVTLARA